MDLTNYPEESFEKLGFKETFPITIVYKYDDTGNMNHVRREYQKCGCFVHYPNFVEKIPFSCTLHDGQEPCFFSKGKQKKKLYQLLGEYERALLDLKLKQQEILRKIERDRSPERKKPV
jgi:hypothetical protein